MTVNSRSLTFLIRLALLALAAIAVAGPAPGAAAQTGIADLRSDADYVYGQSMRFRLRAADLGDIERLTLFFRPHTSADSYAVEIPLPAEPGIDVSYTLDLTETPLAPFSSVTYWWELKRTDGVTLRVPEQTVTYVDDQFSWQNLTTAADEEGGGTLGVHWTGDNPAIGTTALTLIEEMVPRIGALLPLSQIVPFDTYIYPSAADLGAALRLAGLEWQPGRSYPELGAVLVTAVNDSTAAADLRAGISRELTELLLYQALGPDSAVVPTWVRAGISAVASNDLDARLDAVLSDAVAGRRTVPLAELCTSSQESKADPDLFLGQSASLLRYIRDNYGDEAVSEMVAAFGRGATCDAAFEAAIGGTTAEVEEAWLMSLRGSSPAARGLGQGILLLILLAGGFGLVALLIRKPRPRRARSQAR
jgi:hypothetical protein